jgi:hypothetical protein
MNGLASEKTLRGQNIETVVVDLLSTGTENTSPAAAGYSLSTAKTGFCKWQTLRLDATITGATGGTIDVLVETSPDGTTWYEMWHIAQSAAAAAAKSITVSFNRGTGYATTIGVGTLASTTMTLASGAAVDGQWFDRLRVRMVAGTSTSAGAVQSVKASGLVYGA